MNEVSPGPVILDIDSTRLSEADAHLLKRPEVGGVILFSRNYESLNQLNELTAAIKALRPGLVIAVDHEGGRVQRFKEGFTRIPPMQAYGRYYQQDRNAALVAARETGWLLASELIAADIEFSFAPVLDVDDCISDIIGDRSFSSDPELVVILGGALIDGMHDAGMATTGKHFPGHGGVKADSHLELPRDPRPMEELLVRDLLPFARLLPKLDAIMPAHIVFSAVDPLPVGFSPYWVKSLLKEEWGFNGVVFSDDLTMEGAATVGGYARRAELAFAAGCDVILVCNNRPAALETVDYVASRKDPAESCGLEKMRALKPFDAGTLRESARWRNAADELSRVQSFISLT